MKFNLRSLMIVVLVLPPLLAGAWFCWQSLRPKEFIPYQAIDTGLMPLDAPPETFIDDSATALNP